MWNTLRFGVAEISNVGGRTTFLRTAKINRLAGCEFIRGLTIGQSKIDNVPARSCAKIGAINLKRSQRLFAIKTSTSRSISIVCALTPRRRTGKTAASKSRTWNAKSEICANRSEERRVGKE